MTQELQGILEHCHADGALQTNYLATRQLSKSLIEGLGEADLTVQSMPDASPAKWHLAHTTWFFETFLLRDAVPGYDLFDERWPYLFNSYYEAEGERIARAERGLITRPSVAEMMAYREHVDRSMLAAWPLLAERHRDLLELGIQHEQQHQELLLMDIKHLFSRNPLGPAYAERTHGPASEFAASPLRWIEGETGAAQFGHEGPDFAFDNEMPRHTAWLSPHALANRPVINEEWLAFMADGGYRTPSLWLSDGWDWVGRNGVTTPLYWRERDGTWEHFTLSGWQPVDPAAPICHVSFYEADAFSAWAGARLPTEHEWEAAAARHDSCGGVQLDGHGAPSPVAEIAGDGFASLFGNVWEWTGSAYRPHPGFRSAPGAVGEYNGKFMSGQFVLKGGCCATPRGHVRASYRNFFHPHQRWQFSGVRLARSL